MMETEAVDFLLRCSRKDEQENQEQDAKTLVQELRYLRLAIEQAGSYIREQGISISRYFSLYKMNQSNALKQNSLCLTMCTTNIQWLPLGEFRLLKSRFEIL